MSNPLMEKMLDLPEFEVTDFKQNDNDMGFYVETKKRPTFCPKILLQVRSTWAKKEQEPVSHA